ncbi:MAG: hypothetical protein LBO09_05775 [Candidatus Peribacteria bacterium]|nr:hypothetical protein [Candidatus Peribacteria bacterium]
MSGCKQPGTKTVTDECGRSTVVIADPIVINQNITRCGDGSGPIVTYYFNFTSKTFGAVLDDFVKKHVETLLLITYSLEDKGFDHGQGYIVTFRNKSYVSKTTEKDVSE